MHLPFRRTQCSILWRESDKAEWRTRVALLSVTCMSPPFPTLQLPRVNLIRCGCANAAADATAATVDAAAAAPPPLLLLLAATTAGKSSAWTAEDYSSQVGLVYEWELVLRCKKVSSSVSLRGDLASTGPLDVVCVLLACGGNCAPSQAHPLRRKAVKTTLASRAEYVAPAVV